MLVLIFYWYIKYNNITYKMNRSEAEEQHDAVNDGESNDNFG